jgi:hypothetical protein
MANETPEKIALTWREKNDFQFVANNVTQILYTDTRPNVFILKNHSNTTVFVGKTNNLSDTHFEMSIPPQGLKLFQKPYGLSALHLFALSDAKIDVASFEGRFDPGDIMQTQGDIAQVNVNALPVLPAGNNNIGDVDIASMPALPAGNNNIGKVTSLLDGWTWIKITSAAGGDENIKAGPGVLALMVLDAAGPTVILKDGAMQAWKTGEYIQPYPIAFLTNITVNFSAAGSVWVLFR